MAIETKRSSHLYVPLPDLSALTLEHTATLELLPQKGEDGSDWEEIEGRTEDAHFIEVVHEEAGSGELPLSVCIRLER